MLGLVGSDKDLPRGRLKGWCGKVIEYYEWSFQDADHVLLALAGGTAITPCRKCLRRMLAVINKELAL